MNELEATEKGAYRCPGCGLRYDSAGYCNGKTEAGHQPIAVEKIAGSKSDGDGDGEKSSSSRKTSSARSRGGSKRKTAAAGK